MFGKLAARGWARRSPAEQGREGCDPRIWRGGARAAQRPALAAHGARRLGVQEMARQAPRRVRPILRSASPSSPSPSGGFSK